VSECIKPQYLPLFFDLMDQKKPNPTVPEIEIMLINIPEEYEKIGEMKEKDLNCMRDRILQIFLRRLKDLFSNLHKQINQTQWNVYLNTMTVIIRDKIFHSDSQSELKKFMLFLLLHCSRSFLDPNKKSLEKLLPLIIKVSFLQTI